MSHGNFQILFLFYFKYTCIRSALGCNILKKYIKQNRSNIRCMSLCHHQVRTRSASGVPFSSSGVISVCYRRKFFESTGAYNCLMLKIDVSK